MVIVQYYRAHVALSGCVYACVPAWAGSAAYGTRSVYTALLYAAKIGIGHGRVTVTLRSHRHIDGDDRQKYHPLSIPIIRSRFLLFPAFPFLLQMCDYSEWCASVRNLALFTCCGQILVKRVTRFSAYHFNFIKLEVAALELKIGTQHFDIQEFRNSMKWLLKYFNAHERSSMSIWKILGAPLC